MISTTSYNCSYTSLVDIATGDVLGELERRYGTNGRAGERGEAMFERGLKAFGISEIYTVRHSLNIPDAGRKPMQGDVDFILGFSTRVVLADLKLWNSNEAMWTTPDGQLMHGDTPDPKRPSRNMEIALERYSELLPHCKVSAMVIFMPSDGGAETEIDVDRFIWPGNIRSYSASQSYSEIARRIGRIGPLGVPHALDPAMDKLLTAMQKSNTVDR